MAVALAVMVVWGGTPLFSKIAAREIDPLLVGILRTVIAGAAAVPFLLGMHLPLPRQKRERTLLGVSAVTAFVAFPLLFTVGQSQTSAMHGSLILATLPVFTSLFGTLVERRRVSALWITGCSIALAGEAVVIVWRTAGNSSGASLAGDALVLLSSVICAVGYVAGARLSQRGYPSLATTLWGVAVSAVILLPLMWWSVATQGWPQASAAAWGSVLVLALLTSILGYVAWYWALAHGGISRIASVQFTQPIFGLILAAVVLSERPAPVTLVAGAAILSGAWLVQKAGAAA
jgi:drug/metabolite transporter (DMT)-like permease